MLNAYKGLASSNLIIDRALENILFFTNVELETTDWVDNTDTPDTGFEDYDYKAVIECEGVTEDMLPYVIFYDNEAKSGDYSLTCKSDENSITIYSNNDNGITIPTLFAGVPVIVDITETTINSIENNEEVTE